MTGKSPVGKSPALISDRMLARMKGDRAKGQGNPDQKDFKAVARANSMSPRIELNEENTAKKGKGKRGKRGKGAKGKKGSRGKSPQNKGGGGGGGGDLV